MFSISFIHVLRFWLSHDALSATVAGLDFGRRPALWPYFINPPHNYRYKFVATGGFFNSGGYQQ
jgi:hypothetical protein